MPLAQVHCNRALFSLFVLSSTLIMRWGIVVLWAQEQSKHSLSPKGSWQICDQSLLLWLRDFYLTIKMCTHSEVAAMVLRANVPPMPQFSDQHKGWCPITSGDLKIKCFAIHYWHFSRVEESAYNSYHRGPQDTYTRQADLLVVSEQV